MILLQIRTNQISIERITKMMSEMGKKHHHHLQVISANLNIICIVYNFLFSRENMSFTAGLRMGLEFYG